jgi:two-component system cell cycle response regulator
MSPARILVVDDNPTNLKLVVDLLECEGHEILQAIDAEEAERIIAREHPELVLMDLALPGMDGLTLIRKLRADEKTKDLTIIALTAFAMKGDEQKAIAAGCNGYITKPINTRSLPGLVAGFLPRGEIPPPRPPLNILVIEDAVSELKLARHVLTVDGHRVQGMGAAEEALAAIRRNRPEIILLDMLLPGVNGLALARLLKAEPDTRDIPIVAITSFPERFTRQDALAAGCEAFLVKPMDTRRLPQQLEEVMSARRTSREGPAP